MIQWQATTSDSKEAISDVEKTEFITLHASSSLWHYCGCVHNQRLCCKQINNEQWRIHGGVGGGSTPPMTGPTKIFSIEFNMIYSVLCVIYAVSLAQ
jgi:hypothetical protein